MTSKLSGTNPNKTTSTNPPNLKVLNLSNREDSAASSDYRGKLTNPIPPNNHKNHQAQT